MNGLMYAQEYHNDSQCVFRADGNSRELKITFLEGNCGLSKTPAAVNYINRFTFFFIF